MTTLFGTILATALMAQFQGRTLQGTVVDDQGKPVAEAQVIFHASAPWKGDAEPVEVRAKSDDEGRFRLTTFRMAGVDILDSKVWAYRPGSAIAAVPCRRQPLALVLRKPEPRIVKIAGPGGQPVVGARISPRAIIVASAGAGNVPDTLAAPGAVTTGPDGTATLNCLVARDQLMAVRITAESIGTQDLQIIEETRRNVLQGPITIHLKPTSWLAGRVRNRAGQPIADQAVEVWFKGGSFLEPNPVGFKNGPIRTAADGSFQTPDNLLVGSSYRVVVRLPGKEPILSDWITIEEKPRILLPMLQRPLRTISGAVVDRQGKPVVGVEVFQSGDGPERTSTKTDAAGRFTLGGFSQGPVFVFARGEGFRFFGRLIKSSDGDISVDLTRTVERPTHEMRMLPGAIPPEESRALARQLMEPYWDDFDNKNIDDKFRILHSIAGADPVNALRKLEEEKFPDERMKSSLQTQVAQTLAQTEPSRAEAVAEAIEDPALRCSARMAVVDALADAEHDRKVALLDRAAVQLKAAGNPSLRLHYLAELADRWYELGEKEKAKTLLAEGLVLANQVANKTARSRGRFAARLARVDLPSALAIAKEFRASRTVESERWVLWNIVFQLAADNPAEAERVLRQIPQETGQYWLPSAIAWKLAGVDPARARRLVEEAQRYYYFPQQFLFLAHGAKSRDPAVAHQAFQAAIEGIDRLMKEGEGYSLVLDTLMLEAREVFLPIVEQIDPALVPELFWRVVATRPSVGNPRDVPGDVAKHWSSRLVAVLGWYDRDVAVALFEPIRAQLEHTDDLALARSPEEFLAWLIFDPRAAVARLKQVPVDPKFELYSGRPARFQVADMLGRSRETRWRLSWRAFTYMSELIAPGPGLW
jgi:Carboxypeptidase regulatory-like domain